MRGPCFAIVCNFTKLFSPLLLAVIACFMQSTRDDVAPASVRFSVKMAVALCLKADMGCGCIRLRLRSTRRKFAVWAPSRAVRISAMTSTHTSPQHTRKFGQASPNATPGNFRLLGLINTELLASEGCVLQQVSSSPRDFEMSNSK